MIENIETRSILQIEGRESKWNERFDLIHWIAGTNPTTCILLNLVQRDNNNLVLAGTTFYLYEEIAAKEESSKEFRLRQGHYKLRLWPGRPADYPQDPKECKTCGIPQYPEFSQFKELATVETVRLVRLIAN